MTTSVSLHDVVRDLKDERDELRAENARLRAALAAAPRWVPVTERLPLMDGQLLLVQQAFHDRTLITGAYIAYSRAFNTHYWTNERGMVEVVTHWLELPPAPGAEA